MTEKIEVKNKGKVYRSMEEIEKNFFPKEYEKKLLEKHAKSNSLGSYLAKQSLNKVKKKLDKISL